MTPSTTRRRPVTERNIKDYLVTIKCNSIRYASRLELLQVYSDTVKKLKGGEWISKVCWELDSFQRLHIHTIVSTSRTPCFKLLQQKGYTVHLEQISEGTYSTVYDYIHKHNQHPACIDNIDNLSYYSHNYAFIG